MKLKLLFGGIIFLLVLTSTAQITINRSNIGNLVGAYVIQANDTTNLNALSPGNAGASQTWNLTGIGNDFQDTMQFSRPVADHCSKNYPNATLELQDTTTSIFIFDDNSVIEILGVCGILNPPDTSSIPFSPPQKHLTFPSTYNTTFSGQTKAVFQFPINPPPPDSARLIQTLTYNSLIDGWGTVNTPSGTFTCLRQKYTQYEIDSLFIYLSGIGWQPFGSPSYDTTIDYSWWSKNNPFIAQITTDFNGHIQNAKYMISSNIGITEKKDSPITYSVFPNPSNGKFALSANNSKITALEIYNVIGEKIFIKSINLDQSSVKVDLTNFPKGIYFIKIMEGEKTQTEKLIIQ